MWLANSGTRTMRQKLLGAESRVQLYLEKSFGTDIAAGECILRAELLNRPTT
jgi:hypothetical protein